MDIDNDDADKINAFLNIEIDGEGTPSLQIARALIPLEITDAALAETFETAALMAAANGKGKLVAENEPNQISKKEYTALHEVLSTIELVASTKKPIRNYEGYLHIARNTLLKIMRQRATDIAETARSLTTKPFNAAVKLRMKNGGENPDADKGEEMLEQVEANTKFQMNHSLTSDLNELNACKNVLAAFDVLTEAFKKDRRIDSMQL